ISSSIRTQIEYVFFFFKQKTAYEVGSGLVGSEMGIRDRVTPCLSALVSLHAPMEQQGAVLGAYQASGSLGRIIGPALGGLLFTRLGPTAPYGTGAVLVALGGLLALSLVTQVRLSGAGAEQSS
ncbi:MFS transporter, partial [Corallococcus exiguus]|uniref:MFS transporter n=1 Tax=Corallococcus exiguus TaxID=83462 RepID=UPI0020B704DA